MTIFKKKFVVRLVGTAQVYSDLPILAETFEEAQDKALDFIANGTVKWRLSDNEVDGILVCNESGDT